MLVNYQNVPKLIYRISKVSTADIQNRISGDDDQRKKILTALLKRASVVEKTVSLPDDGDLNQHTVEVPLSGLPVGQYILLATADDKLQNKPESVQYAAFTVSTLGFITLSANNAAPNQTIYVTNRLTGEPMKNASVVVIPAQKNTPASNRNAMQTDGAGRIKIPASALPMQESFQYLITSGTDTLLSDPQYNYRYNNGRK